MSEYVITRRSETTEFWTGAGWSNEYADAKIFQSVAAAKKDNAMALGNLVFNYGMEDQAEV
jgi:hypothetical protein